MDKEQRIRKLAELDAKLWELTRKLTAAMIPFNPPVSGDSLKRMKKNNINGYNILMEYITLLEEEKLLRKSK